jgi:hypothetical protein
MEKSTEQMRTEEMPLPRTECLDTMWRNARETTSPEPVRSGWPVRHRFLRLWDGPNRAIFASRLVKFDNTPVYFELERSRATLEATCFDGGVLRIDIRGIGRVQSCPTRQKRIWGQALWEQVSGPDSDESRWRGLAFNESVQVQEWARRRGVATALYDLVDTTTEGGTVWTECLTGDGTAFWKERNRFRRTNAGGGDPPS